MTREEIVNELKYIYESFAKNELSQEALTVAINTLEKPDQRWIPIAERKPEKHGSYLVSVYDHNRKCLEVGISYFYPEVNEFSSCNAYENYYWEVTAWMERPEPYHLEDVKKKRKRGDRR